MQFWSVTVVNEHHCDDYKIIILIPSFHLLQCVFMPKTLASPCGPNTPGAAPCAAPLWHGSEVNKQKIHTIPSTEIKTVYIGLLPAGWAETEAT